VKLDASAFSGSVNLVGSNGPDVLIGGAGNDRILGLSGGDTLSGGAGNDYIDGGIDNDTISAGTGANVVIGGGGNDVLSELLGTESIRLTANSYVVGSNSTQLNSMEATQLKQTASYLNAIKGTANPSYGGSYLPMPTPKSGPTINTAGYAGQVKVLSLTGSDATNATFLNGRLKLTDDNVVLTGDPYARIDVKLKDVQRIIGPYLVIRTGLIDGVAFKVLQFRDGAVVGIYDLGGSDVNGPRGIVGLPPQVYKLYKELGGEGGSMLGMPNQPRQVLEYVNGEFNAFWTFAKGIIVIATRGNAPPTIQFIKGSVYLEFAKDGVDSGFAKYGLPIDSVYKTPSRVETAAFEKGQIFIDRRNGFKATSVRNTFVVNDVKQYTVNFYDYWRLYNISSPNLGIPVGGVRLVQNSYGEYSFIQSFENGVLVYAVSKGVTTSVQGVIAKEYLRKYAGPAGELGAPTSKETSSFGVDGKKTFRSDFAHGTILFRESDRKFIVLFRLPNGKVYKRLEYDAGTQ